MPDTEAGQPFSTTVARAGEVLHLLAESPAGIGITDLTRRLNTQRAPLYRILEALIRHRLVSRDDQKRYRLGVGTIQLARAYSAQFPAGMEQMLRDLANEAEITATLVSADGDVLTTVVSVTPSTNAEHVFTPPGFRHPMGPLATRIAIEASRPPAEGDSEAVRDARKKGYAVAQGTVAPVRFAVAAAVPSASATGSTLAVALVSLEDFDADAIAPSVVRTAQLLSMTM
ncbi:helix-turn-helix domain-containing protein [Microbacterium caowuchunii]|uniref:helix-turn-helix domain-containing protein n=1 Tax=Microbacterium caowuchunii TaxID=2614638 RepID=UPI001786DAB6|nr:helix-turn-helix domain-containing protein [Microbacterium caowuchunii]